MVSVARSRCFIEKIDCSDSKSSIIIKEPTTKKLGNTDDSVPLPHLILQTNFSPLEKKP
jgi:hypothetical protein